MIRSQAGCGGCVDRSVPAIHDGTARASFNPGPAIRGWAFAEEKPC